MHNENRLARGQTDDEPLMPAAGEVVVQYERYYAFAFNLDITCPCFERTPDFTVVTRSNAIVSGVLTSAP